MLGRDTDPATYADSVIAQVTRLLARGVAPEPITVVSASKGAVIAMLVSTRLVTPIRYVMLGNCNAFIRRRFQPQLHGQVLSIYEASDSLGQSCREIFMDSRDLQKHAEVRLTTGLRHGFLFRPLQAWLGPAVSWARRGDL